MWWGRNLGLVSHLGHLAKHNSCVSVEERDAGQALTVLEGVHNQRLCGLEDKLGHLIRLEGVGLFQLLTTSLLSDLNVHIL
jgi:hypothetical protein